MSAFVKVFYRGTSDEEKAAALESALKSFKRKVEREGTIKEVRRREEYQPPSVVKRMKHKESIKRSKKMESKRRRFNRDYR